MADSGDLDPPVSYSSGPAGPAGPSTGTKLKTGLASVGSSLSKGFGITKQFVKQKMGKSEVQPESKEFLAALERLHVANRSFIKLFKATQSVFAAFPTAENDGKTFLEDDIKSANKLEKDYTIARLDYDARSETVRDLQKNGKKDKISLAQAKLDEATDAYEKIKAKLQKAIDYIDEQKEKVHKDTIATCCELLQSLKPEWESKTQPDSNPGEGLGVLGAPAASSTLPSEPVAAASAASGAVSGAASEPVSGDTSEVGEPVSLED